MDLPEQFKDLGSVARQEGYSNGTGAAAEKCLFSDFLLQHIVTLKVCVYCLAVPVWHLYVNLFCVLR